MAIAPITQVSGTAVPIPGADIDTDRIIPARFMKCVTFDGLGEFLFYDVRKDDDGNDKEHPLNESKFAEASILISNANFGCGSSREHAPQALYRYGFRAIIAESFAEIFFGNCCGLGVPCAVASADDIKKITDIIDANPDAEIHLSVIDSEVVVGDLHISVEIPKAAKDALTLGRWDPIAELQEAEKDVNELVNQLGYITS